MRGELTSKGLIHVHILNFEISCAYRESAEQSCLQSDS
jgi:hypothetical protein